MTMQDFIVVGAGTLIIFALFLIYGWVQEVGTIGLWPIVRRYVAVRLVEPMRDDGRSSADGAAGDADDLRRAQPHQLNDDFDDENAAGREAIVLRQLTKTELIVMLAVQRKDDGSYLWSSNDIKKFVPGTDGPIGEIIANVRGKKETPPPPTSLHRPVNGW